MATRRRRAAANPPEPDLATIVANLQRQLQKQQQETDRLREQLTQLNQRPQANEVPPQDNRIPVITDFVTNYDFLFLKESKFVLCISI